MSYPISEIVTKIGEISIRGNIIPDQWYTHLRNDKGKIQINSAIILAEILYWYRPVPVYDIKTGQQTGFGKKFKDDLLQLNYTYFSEKFGFTTSQSRSAIIFLEQKGLIFREFRDIIVEKHALNNVMFINICPQRIQEITGLQEKTNLVTTETHQSQSRSLSTVGEPIKPFTPKVKDWSSKFSDDQKTFLQYLLSIKPEHGDPIQKNNATWWIKHFGIAKIETALQVYWQQVEKAKNDSDVPMPESIGKYVRKALNDGYVPNKVLKETQASNQTTSSSSQVSTEAPVKSIAEQDSTAVFPYSENSQQGVKNFEGGVQKNQKTNTEISLLSLPVNEVNDLQSSVTSFDKADHTSTSKTHVEIVQQKKKFNSKKKNSAPNWSENFSVEEKKFLAYLLKIIPEKGSLIEEKHATWWIKHFGIAKIKTALQVYWQQVEKAKKNQSVPMPASIGAYVRNALDNAIQPCREGDLKNKSFAERFKRHYRWGDLTITERYCRVEGSGKEWYYHMPESLFQDSLKTFYENSCTFEERLVFIA
ncbi:conserved hypothetical protein (plasmid) [Candidatus Protochlamydia naegleriophila]|uniref:Uncharacterized protein n=1 Tax=Candidatus Protochlamydia naegleriophila TaxID=389348 RepID=A0A0U5JFT4_9BACT|nr:hypothetical protein [Candidatus Protochlamydia naegleriophila]CUI18055.1 conserved hypothetical protein [Candidatus Protochlamydia naegleriophila]